jgi:hypothetical protein
VGWFSCSGVVERLLSFAARALSEVTAWLRLRSDNPAPRRGGWVVVGVVDDETGWAYAVICKLLAIASGIGERQLTAIRVVFLAFSTSISSQFAARYSNLTEGFRTNKALISWLI